MTDDPGLPRSDRGDPGVDWVHIRLPESHICTRRFHRAIVSFASQPFQDGRVTECPGVHPQA